MDQPEPVARRRERTVDQLAADRRAAALPPEPVFAIDLVEAEAPGRGRRRVSDLEVAAGHNAQAAREARRIALEQRRHLEALAEDRAQAEREMASLRLEVRRLTAEQERLAAQLRFRAEQESKRADVPDQPARHDAAVRDALVSHEELIAGHRDRLREMVRERDEARLEAQRSVDARKHAERRLALAAETLQRNAADEQARIGAAEESVRLATEERDRLAAELARLEAGESRSAELSNEVERLRDRVAELEAAVVDRQRRAEEGERRGAVLAEDLEAAWQEHAVATGMLTVARGERDEAREEGVALRQLVGGLEAKVDELRAWVEGAQDRHAQAVGRGDELAGTLAVTAGERDAAIARADALEQTLARIESERIAQGEELDGRADRIEELEVLLAEAAAARDDSTARLAALDADLAATGSAREASAARAGELEALLRDAERRAVGAEKEILQLRRAAARAERVATKAEATATTVGQARATEAEKWKAEVASLEAELDAARAESAAFGADLAAARNEMESTRAESAAFGADLAAARNEMEAAGIEIERLQSALERELARPDPAPARASVPASAPVGETAELVSELAELAGTAEVLPPSEMVGPLVPTLDLRRAAFAHLTELAADAP